jgi:hypothetical protein
MEYDSSNLPPAGWLHSRHGIPAMFRDSFGHTAWWSAEQQTAIRTALDRWASRTFAHPLHACTGYVCPASTRATPRVQRGPRQRHTLGYFVDQLHRTDSAAGLILYGIDVALHPLTAAIRGGPAGLDLHRYDVLLHSGTVGLSLIAGMVKTWTRPHVDTAGDSVWQLLVEGEKLWVLARPEKKDAMKAQFHKDRTIRWSQFETTDRDWLVDNRCLQILQRAGDLLYIPSGWVHMVCHLTDTIAINSNLLHGWDFASAVDALDFGRFDEGEWGMYEAAYRLAVAPTAAVGLRWDEAETRAVWERKRQQWLAGVAQREEAAKEEAGAGQQSKRVKRKGG